ncbi:glycine cleavage system protein GcvH [Wielerella bovis]|uniref:glycine cleavage system protein GcvH n=1 Tax=Wielerella bovis TaxID=2917790 RepID=UPI002019A012|nr:glycine cleavage system protein GcvH [Wielerella bovis]MCG7657002.1 glycine cleavage system protein GcvH [Wielerella bovis]MCG7659225.1 glycine cleavage system protein GcvH [Wielerella bovis]
MSQIPENLAYTATHQWLRTETNSIATIGITDYAQETLGDIIFVELPKIGDFLSAQQHAATVESVKSASDVYCPVAGEVVAINTALLDAPELANSQPYDTGWFFQIRPSVDADFVALLTAEQYAKEINE